MARSWFWALPPRRWRMPAPPIPVRLAAPAHPAQQWIARHVRPAGLVDPVAHAVHVVPALRVPVTPRAVSSPACNRQAPTPVRLIPAVPAPRRRVIPAQRWAARQTPVPLTPALQTHARPMPAPPILARSVIPARPARRWIVPPAVPAGRADPVAPVQPVPHHPRSAMRSCKPSMTV